MLSSLNDLLAQHRALEAELADAISHPASTDAELALIKRHKLKLKDQISNLQSQNTLAA
jgi:hypothetical protein